MEPNDPLPERRERPARARPSSADPVPTEELHARIEALAARLAPELADIDPGDLRRILECILRPIGRSGRLFLIREMPPGDFVF